MFLRLFQSHPGSYRRCKSKSSDQIAPLFKTEEVGRHYTSGLDFGKELLGEGKKPGSADTSIGPDSVGETTESPKGYTRQTSELFSSS